MDNIFIHDAVPTWSGFIYQGEIAIYLAVKKICDLKDEGDIVEEDIGLKYQIEVENCEDIAIVLLEREKKQYISIHQVKNQKDKNISKYRSPLVQLMLEKAYFEKNNLGKPMAYLHVSNNINDKSGNVIDENLVKWSEEILTYYNKLKSFEKEINEINKIKKLSDIENEVKNETIGLNRSQYISLIDKIIKICKSDDKNINQLKPALNDLIAFLENELSVPTINKNVNLYEYEDRNKYCNGTNIYCKIIEQVKRYKNNNKKITDSQYEYIANKLLDNMRNHILERHIAKQKNGDYQKTISFIQIQKVLNDDLLLYEKEANILVLRRLYDEQIVEYCSLICKKKGTLVCKQFKECRLKQKEGIDNNDFIKLCYSLNPDCCTSITDRDSLNMLINRDGLRESVFKILNKVPEKYFMKKSDKTKFILDNQRNNAFLTAISNNFSSVVVENIITGIENNAELVSPIFDADQIITSRLEEDESVWDNDYSEIEEKYMKDVSDGIPNSICVPKKPKFIKAQDVINKLSNVK
jgi:hypothetical protein